MKRDDMNQELRPTPQARQPGPADVAGTAVPDGLGWTPDPTMPGVDERRIVDVAFVPMAARLRNELITETYGDLADAMACLLGTEDITWTALGQWASHTVGQVMGVRLPGQASFIERAFGDGNRDVFADIGRAHAIFLDTVGRAHTDEADVAAAWEACQEQLRSRVVQPPGQPGGGLGGTASAEWTDPRSRPDGRNSRSALVLGFRAYYRALGATDREQRSRHILLGNCLLAVHEQHVVSAAIAIGFRMRLRTLLTPWQAFHSRHRWRLDQRSPSLLRLEERWVHLATRYLMGVATPDGRIRAGRTMDGGDDPITVDNIESGGLQPRDLEGLSDGEILGRLFDRFEVDGSPARCWNDHSQRSAFIASLLAEHQRTRFWWSDGGVVRPPRRADLAEQLDQLRLRIDGSAAEQRGGRRTPIRPRSVEAHLGDGELDQLRRLPGYALPRLPDDLSVRQAALPSLRHHFQPLTTEVERRLKDLTASGQHLDAETCKLARDVFQHVPGLWFMGLLLRSLPDAYASAIGVHLLGRGSALAGDPYRRVAESVRFVDELLTADAGWRSNVLDPDGTAFQSVLGVARIHAIVARHVDGAWPDEAYGVPFNQEDLVGTALTFAVPSIEMIDELGFPLTDEQRDAYVRFWLGIGYLLGAPHEAITVDDGDRAAPLNYEQARALADAIRRRHRARSLDGVRFTEALVEGIADGFSRPFVWMSSGLMQVVGDRDVTSLLLLRPGPGRRRASVMTAAFRFLLTNRSTRPLAVSANRLAAAIWLRPFRHHGQSQPFRRLPNDAEVAAHRRAQEGIDAFPVGCLSDEGSTRPRPRAGRRHGGRPILDRALRRRRWRRPRWT